MTSLIRASTSGEGLKDEEIFGNMFVFQFAGHDTTAHTLAFSMMHLAAYPEVQAWMVEEIDYVLGQAEPEEWTYAEVFPRLKRTLAVLVSSHYFLFPVRH